MVFGVRSQTQPSQGLRAAGQARAGRALQILRPSPRLDVADLAHAAAVRQRIGLQGGVGRASLLERPLRSCAAMARPLRMLFPGALYHVMSRGNARALIFLDERDYEKFIEILAASLLRFEVFCYAFCLMPNHYHLVLVTPEANLSAAIKHLNGVYSQWWNHRHQRCGRVFQGRFKAQLVQRERYLLAVCRYVVLKPVRAGLVAHPREWRWSSYRASAHTEPAPGFLDTSALEGLLAGYSGVDSGVAYQQFVNNRPTDCLDIGQLVRDDERFLGDEFFLKDDRALAALRAGRAIPRRETRPPALSLSRLFASTRSKHERNEQIRRAGVELGYRTTDIARHVGLHPVTVGDILRAYRKQPNLKAGDRPAAEPQHDETPVADPCGAPLKREHQDLGEGCVLDLTPED